jgi:hypothetical protein
MTNKRPSWPDTSWASSRRVTPTAITVSHPRRCSEAGTYKALVLELSEHETKGLIAHSRHRPPHARHLEGGSSVVQHIVPHPVLLVNSWPVASGTRRERLIRVGDHVDVRQRLACLLPGAG